MESRSPVAPLRARLEEVKRTVLRAAVPTGIASAAPGFVIARLL